MSVNITTLLGKTLVNIDGCSAQSNEIVFTTTENERFKMHHEQDCCESVFLSEVIGDPQDLLGSEILEAEEISSEGAQAPEYAESYTWTFYKLGTAKGFVTLRWLGQSNGYYSEAVDFTKL